MALQFICAKRLTVLLLFLTLIQSVRADLVVFEAGLIANSSNAALAGTLSQDCITAMEDTVTCDPYLRTQVMNDDFTYLDSSVRDIMCTTACGQSLTTYHAAVESACASSPQPWDNTPATFYGDQIWAQYNISCFRNAAGGYCQNVLADLTIPDSDISMTGLSSSISTCGVSFPTDVHPVASNQTNLPGYAPAGYDTAQCASGKTYTVVTGDDCGKIASSQGVPCGSLIAINNILPTCSDLWIGQILCLPDTCQLYTIQSGDICMAIVNAYDITLIQLLSWNSFINAGCSNLLAGDQVCIQQPSPVWTGTTIAGATATKTGVYATTTVAAPGSVAHDTTTKCGKYYQVNDGDYCQLIALNFTITAALFQQINPSIDDGCTNLVPGLYYCVLPTSDWNETSTTTTSTYVTAPAPTSTGATESCYEWYVVKSGDYCALIEAVYGITMAQLQLWNPELLDNCSNLVLDDAYCINGDAGGSSLAPLYILFPSTALIKNIMSNSNILNYLPPGWSEETYQNNTDADNAALSDEELQKLMDRRVAETKIISAQNLAPINEKRIARGAAPIQPPPSEPEPESSQIQPQDPTLENLQTLVETIESENWTDVGFLMFRTDYSNEDLWNEFLEKFNTILDASIEDAPAESGLSRIADCVFMKIVDDDLFANESPERVAFAYRLCAEDTEDNDPDDRLAPGLHTRMCLFVDGECMRSVVGSGSAGNDGDRVAFVKAVDVMLGLDGVDGNLSFTGVFKVAVRSLITKFYAALLACAETVDLVPAGDGVWDGAH
ncbi:LysM domain protein, partial [Penicillium antarcticum]|uniref:LysM domain protein n=1 Tax=Penicillium antarcticum TaxID=416450 RepID=UPI00238B784D